MLRRQFMAALEQADVLVFATSPFPPPRHTALTAPFVDTNDVRTRFFFCRVYTASYALAVLPVVSIPSRFTSKQLPIGLQREAGLLLRSRCNALSMLMNRQHPGIHGVHPL